LFLQYKKKIGAIMEYNNQKVRKIESGLCIGNSDCLKSIMELMHETNTLGMSIAIVEDNKVKFTKGYGITDDDSGRIVSAETIFQAASISKALTALAVMILVEKGILELNKNVNTYLKSWFLQENEFTKGNPVTLKNLLSHTAGTTVSGFPGYMNKTDIPELINVLNGDSPANTEKITVDVRPNTLCRYSGGGLTIVQQILIDTLNKPYQDIMQEMILQPLHMNSSFFTNVKLPEEKVKHIALGHHYNGSQVLGGYRVHPEMAAAGLWTTAGDLANFIIGVQKAIKGDSDAILTKKFADIMLTPILDGKFNIGFFNQKVGKEILVGHDGGNSGYDSTMLFHKYKGYGITFMANSNNGHKIIMPLLKSVASANEWSDIL